jgi:Taurine catabolism dioxygenase TauD, TfdA family
MGEMMFDAVRVAATPGDDLTELIRLHAARLMRQPPGFFILTGLGPLTEEQGRRVMTDASLALGRLLPQDNAGALIRSVRDRGLRIGEGQTGRYSDSRQGGNLHTDGPHRPGMPPDAFTLLCLSQSPIGGDLVLIHLRDLLRELAGRPHVRDELCRPFHFDRRDPESDGQRTVARPVLSEDRVHYLREYIDIGHRQPGVEPLTPAQVAALDAWDALLDDPRLQTVGRLQPDELAFINNRVILHGRTEFTDDPGNPRHMLRTWIRFDD